VVSARDLGLWYLAAPTDSMRSVSVSSIHSCKGRRIVRPEDVGFGRRVSKC
jgi:hypothetical protein